MWYAKMYFSGSREILQYDSLGSQGLPSVHEEFPFLESLLSFQELDLTEAISMLEYISKNWNRFVAEDDKRALSNAMRKLGALSGIHIYFRHLYVQCYYRLTAMHIQNDRGSTEDAQMMDELRQLPEQLPLYQKQIQRFFDLVLDVDSAGREPQAQAAVNYFHNSPKDPDLFSFRPIPLSFEPVEPGRCSPVLYSSSIRDMIDYSLRSCVERNITVRHCKNCGRYFAQTGRVSAEYCERPVSEGQQRCRDIGALKQWTLRQAGNDAFKAYRKEYKRRFAWIKAGRITDQQFYDWSERARAEKDKCEQGLISQKELESWLKESK